MANDESFDEQQKRQQRRKDNLESVVVCSATKQKQTEWAFISFQQMKMWDDSVSNREPSSRRRGPATSVALILQTTALKDSAQVWRKLQCRLLSTAQRVKRKLPLSEDKTNGNEKDPEQQSCTTPKRSSRALSKITANRVRAFCGMFPLSRVFVF